MSPKATGGAILLAIALLVTGCNWFSDDTDESTSHATTTDQPTDTDGTQGPGTSQTGTIGRDDVAPLSLNPWSWQPPASERAVEVDTYGNALPPGVAQRFGDDELRHAGPIYALTATPDGRTLVSAGADGRVELWDANTGARLRPPLIHPGPVRAVAVPDAAQQRVVTATEDGIVRVWQLPDAHLALEHDTALNPIGALAVAPDGTRLAAAGDDDTLHVYTLAVRTAPPTAPGDAQPPEPDTDDASQPTTPDGDDATLDDPTPEGPEAPGADPPDPAVAADQDNATGPPDDPGDDQPGRDDGSGDPIAIDDAPPGATDDGDDSTATPGGDDDPAPTDDVSGASDDTDDSDDAPPQTGSDVTPRVDDTVVDTSGIWLEVTAERELEGHRDPVEALAWSPDGARLASLDEGGLLLVHELGTGEVTVRLEGLTSAGRHHVVWSPDGQRVAVSGDTVQLVDATSGEQLAVLPGERPLTMSDVVFLDDGNTLVSSHGAELRFWDATTGASRGPAVTTRRPAPISALAVAGQPPRLAVAQDRGIVLLDPATERVERAPTGHTDALTDLAVVPGAPLRVVSAALDGTVELWDPRTSARSLELAHPAAVTDLDIDPGGRVLITASPLSAPHTWRLPEGTLHRVLEDFEGIAHVALLDGGKVAALADSVGALHLLDTDSGQRLRTWSVGDRPAVAIAATPDRQALAVVLERDGATRIEVHAVDTLLDERPEPEGRRRRPATPALPTPRLAIDAFMESGTPLTLAYGPSGRRLAVISRDPLVGGQVTLYDLTAEDGARRVMGTVDRIDARQLTFSPDGGLVLVGTGDGQLAVLDTGLHAAAGQVAPRQLVERIVLDGHDAAITAIAVVPGTDLVVTGSADTTALLWDLAELRRYIAPYKATPAPAPTPPDDASPPSPGADDTPTPTTDGGDDAPETD